MSSPGSVTYWLHQLQARDPAAAQQLWERYCRRLVGLARKKLRDWPRRAADEEDVAQSALKSFFLGVEQNRFPKLADRHDLWPLLVVITVRKALDLKQHDRRKKRGGGAVRGESVFAARGETESAVGGLDQVLGSEPTPAVAAQVSEEVNRLLGILGDSELRSVAMWKLEGYTNEEIATRLGRSRAAVERKLAFIRRIWERENRHGQ